MKLSTSAIQSAFIKHLGKNLAMNMKVNLDEAFLILRELEEAYLKYDSTAPGKEPFDHYMAAYRLMPQQFREGLDDIYLDRQGKKEILPPKKPPDNAKPG